MNNLRIGGFTPFSTVDYPDMLVSVIFLQGCSWKCYYCHNKPLIPIYSKDNIQFEDILRFIKTRLSLLDGVVFSGGEPLLQIGLLDAVKEIKDLGLLVGLHTGGSVPERLESVLPYIKLPLDLAKSIGKKASNLCKQRNIKIGKVSDERFSHVNSYPISILDEVVAPLNLL